MTRRMRMRRRVTHLGLMALLVAVAVASTAAQTVDGPPPPADVDARAAFEAVVAEFTELGLPWRSGVGTEPPQVARDVTAGSPPCSGTLSRASRKAS